MTEGRGGKEGYEKERLCKLVVEGKDASGESIVECVVQAGRVRVCGAGRSCVIIVSPDDLLHYQKVYQYEML